MKTINKIGIISLAFFLFISCKKEKQPNIIQVPSIQVTSPIVRDITLTKQYPGFLSSDKTVNLVARVNGYLQTSLLKAGAFVKKGTLIFIIEPEIYKNNGYDIALVQRLLQHSSAATTQRYIGIEPQRIEAAIEAHTQLL